MFVGCDSSANGIQSSLTLTPAEPLNDIFFPVSQENEMHLEALIIGTLVLIDQCLFLSADDPEMDYLVIWPFGFSYEKQGSKIQILNAEGKVVTEEGKQISVGGGTHSSMSLPANTPQDFNCNGPLWNASPEIKILENDGA